MSRAVRLAELLGDWRGCWRVPLVARYSGIEIVNVSQGVAAIVGDTRL